MKLKDKNSRPDKSIKRKINLLSDRSAGEKYLSIWWFFILAVIGLGIIAGVYVFSYAEFKVKEVEADVLANKVVDCLIENGKLKDLAGEKIFDFCYLNKEMIDKSRKYYLEIKIYGLEDCKIKEIEKCKLIEETSFGNSDFKVQCGYKEKGKITGEEKAKYFASCSEKYVYVINKGKDAVLYVLAGSNQEGGENAGKI